MDQKYDNLNDLQYPNMMFNEANNKAEDRYLPMGGSPPTKHVQREAVGALYNPEAPENDAVVIGEENVLDDIEECALIESVDSGNTKDFVTDLKDCPGYCATVPYALPNADHENVTTIVKEINKQSGHSTRAWQCCMGRLVERGNLGIYEYNGFVQAVSAGRYGFRPGARCFRGARWVDTEVKIDQAVYCHKSLLIVRVARGELGLVMNNGNAQILGAGSHVFNSGVVQFKRMVSEDESHIQFGPYHVVRVSRGTYGRCWAPAATGGGWVPRLLDEGLHVICNALFRFVDFVDVLQEYVNHGSTHIINVPKGSVARVFHDNRPRLLGRGCHKIESVNFEYEGMASLLDKRIEHGTITIVRVNKGEIGLCWEYNLPKFIDKSGTYAFNSPNFQFVAHKSVNERVIELGPKKIIQVYTGEVGVSYDNGELRILDHGRHVIDSAQVIFEDFLSTQQKSLRLVSLSAGEKTKKKDQRSNDYVDPNVDLLVCETKDLVKVGCRADVFYSVADPKKAMSCIDRTEIEDLVRETAIATLTNIIRSTSLNEIAQSKIPTAISSEQEEKNQEFAAAAGSPSAPLFFDKAHDEFLSKLHDDFLSRYGLEITNIRIENFKICDDELANSISKQALVTAQTENELANLQGKRQIATSQQHREAEVLSIKTESEATALKMKADAENQRLIEAAKAEAEAKRQAVLLEAEAHAEAVKIKALADAEAIQKIAQAEAQRAQMLSETELGKQSSLLKIYCDMVTKTNEGIDKVYYCDPSLAKDGNPFQMPALLNINRDLSQLQGIGENAGYCGYDQLESDKLNAKCGLTKKTATASGA